MEKTNRVVLVSGTGLEIRFNRHPKRKNGMIVAGMYEAYKNGKSLNEIAKMYRKTRQAIYDIFKARGYSLRSKQLLGLTILDGINFTLMKGGYLRGTVKGKRMTMQKYVWEKNNGPIPEGFVIYHKNKIKIDNRIENLELVEVSLMSKKFNPKGNNQYKKDASNTIKIEE
jgi:hypothetical protein